MNSEKSLMTANDTDTGKTDGGVGRAQPKKPYHAPQLIEHGSVEEITGNPPSCAGSGCFG
jgi:hypothetical protein